MARALALPRDGDVLEVGCGRANALPGMSRLLTPRRLVGLDVDSRLLGEAHRDMELARARGRARCRDPGHAPRLRKSRKAGRGGTCPGVGRSAPGMSGQRAGDVDPALRSFPTHWRSRLGRGRHSGGGGEGHTRRSGNSTCSPSGLLRRLHIARFDGVASDFDPRTLHRVADDPGETAAGGLQTGCFACLRARFEHYNHRRPHSGIGARPRRPAEDPADRRRTALPPPAPHPPGQERRRRPSRCRRRRSRRGTAR